MNVSYVGKYHLTRREDQVLHLLAQGLCDKKIAQILETNPSTIKSQCRGIYQKLLVDSRFQAVVKAFREGLVDIHEDIHTGRS